MADLAAVREVVVSLRAQAARWGHDEPPLPCRSMARAYEEYADRLEAALGGAGEQAPPDRISIRRSVFRELFAIVKAATQLDDAIAEFGLAEPSVLAEAAQALHDVIPRPAERLARVLAGIADGPAPDASGEVAG